MFAEMTKKNVIPVQSRQGSIRPLRGLDRVNQNNNNNNNANKLFTWFYSSLLVYFPELRDHWMQSDIEFGPVGKLNPLHYSPLRTC